MRRQQTFLTVVVLGLAGLAVSCSSDSSGCADGGDAACGTSTGGAGGGGGGAGGAGGAQPFGLTGGDSCFEVTAFDPTTFIDGCGEGALVSDAAKPPSPLIVPLNYDGATGTVKLGTDGSLGQGTISNNKGTLVRENDPVDAMIAACMWHQKNTSMVTLIANNMFIINVTEDETMFAAACADTIPTGGMCTSKWTWTMKKSAKTPPCNTP